MLKIKIMNDKGAGLFKKIIAFITSAGFVFAATGISVVLAAITFSGTSITGDSSFTNVTGVVSSTWDFGAGTLSLQTASGSPVTIGGALNVSSTVNMSSTLNVVGTTTLAAALTQSGGVAALASTTINGNATTTGALSVGGTLTASVIDRSGTITIGGTNGTTIAIGRSGQTVSFPGAVSSTSMLLNSTGTAIVGHFSTTASLTFGAISSSTPCSDLGVTVNGVAGGDTVALGPPTSVTSNTLWSAYVSSTANTVMVRLCAQGNGAGTINPVAGTWRVDVWKH